MLRALGLTAATALLLEVLLTHLLLQVMLLSLVLLLSAVLLLRKMRGRALVLIPLVGIVKSITGLCLRCGWLRRAATLPQTLLSSYL